jgi:hypothetical protein
MNVQKATALVFPLGVTLFLAGIGLIYYGFELVSIPHITEHHETTWILVGILMAIAGGLTVVYKVLNRPKPKALGDPGKSATGPEVGSSS